jgi:hypothetical protein
MSTSSAFRAKVALVVCLGIAAVVVAFAFPRLAQDPRYHDFADQRTVAGIPNLLNVLSNAVFAVAGFLGLRRGRQRGVAATTLFASAILVAAGSAYYHLHPNNQTLVWDRLPMTLVFMSLFALVIGDRIGPRAGQAVFGPLLAVGIGSVVWWRLSGDLRLYALVQFFPMLAVPLMLFLFRGRYRAAGFCWVMGWYVLAKVFELADRQVFAMGGIVSGHTLKHLAAGIAVVQIWRIVLPDTIPAGRKGTSAIGISLLRRLEAPWN